MTTATMTNQDASYITDFGPVPEESLDLANRQHEVRNFKLTDEQVKAIGEALSFAAQFDNEEVFSAYVDIKGDEGYFTFEIKFNTRPQTIALRYKADLWSAVESHGAHSTSSRKITTETPAKNRGVKTIFHAFLDATVLERVSKELFMKPEAHANVLTRINFKEKTFSAVAPEDALELMPSFPAFSTSVIPKIEVKVTETDTETKNGNEEMTHEEDSQVEDSTPEVEAAAPAETETAPAAPEATKSEAVDEQKVEEPEAKEVKAEEPKAEETKVEETKTEQPTAETKAEEPKAEPPKAEAKKLEEPKAAEKRASEPVAETQIKKKETAKQNSAPARSSSSEGSAKYHTYSQSEVDTLIKRSAENIKAEFTTKVNHQQKLVKENIKNQEHAFKQALDELTVHMEEANKKLDKTAAELQAANARSVDGFKTSIGRELDEFKSHLSKNVMPGMNLLDARLEQLADAKKQGQSVAGMSPGVVVGVFVAIVIIAVVNMIISFYAFERIANLEKSQSEMMTKPATSDVPIPDLMKDQIPKESPTTTP